MSVPVQSISNTDFLRWEVKPIWKVYFPSSLVVASPDSFTIYGVDRGSLDIARNWEKIQSVEQFNQGFVAKPVDFSFTIAIKEHGQSFEKFRRLALGGVMFDIECDLLKDTVGAIGDRPDERPDQTNYNPWLAGFEKYLGCVVMREGQTIELATFPVREFECEFLRHVIKNITGNPYNTSDIKEGDGSHPTLASLVIGTPTAI